MRWQDLRDALGSDLKSTGTLTKTLGRLESAQLIEGADGRYRPRHRDHLASLLDRAAKLQATISAKEAAADSARVERLRQRPSK